MWKTWESHSWLGYHNSRSNPKHPRPRRGGLCEPHELLQVLKASGRLRTIQWWISFFWNRFKAMLLALLGVVVVVDPNHTARLLGFSLIAINLDYISMLIWRLEHKVKRHVYSIFASHCHLKLKAKDFVSAPVRPACTGKRAKPSTTATKPGSHPLGCTRCMVRRHPYSGGLFQDPNQSARLTTNHQGCHCIDWVEGQVVVLFGGL